MNKVLFLLFIFLIGCTNSNKVYICGDHPCKDKNEVDEYFENNISLEVYVIEKDNLKKKNEDLIDLNLSKSKNDEEKKKELAFLNKRKQINNNTKKEQKSSKLKLKVTSENEKTSKDNNKSKTIQPNKKFAYKKQKSTKIVHMCKNIEECDIDIISKKIGETGKDKTFPNINFKK